MIIAVILSVLGLILIYLEFFLPGGVFATGGILLLLSSIIMLFLERTPAMYFLVYSLILGFLIFAIIKSALIQIRSNKNIFLEYDEVISSSRKEKELIGKVGIAFTDLKPLGKIFINEKYYKATSKESFIKKGSKIKVIDEKGADLIVKVLKQTKIKSLK